MFLFQVKEQQASIEEKFRSELNANIKLSNLYKASNVSSVTSEMHWLYFH